MDIRLTAEQVDRYRAAGFLVLADLFGADEMAALHEAYARDSETRGPHWVLERDETAIRAIYAPHRRQPEFARLIRSSRLLGPVTQLLDDKVYPYQVKINTKSPFVGENWAWHQDFQAWKAADNLAEPKLVNAAVFLDAVNEFNGPIIFLPGSHAEGLVRDGAGGRAPSGEHLDPEDIAITPPRLAELVDRYGMTAPKGPAGTVVLFDPQIVHGSAINISPYPRKVVIVTYNEVVNAPRPVGEPRPDYLVGADTTPLEMVSEPMPSPTRRSTV